MKKKIYIEGMTCGHCANHVNEALLEVSGVNSADVNLTDNYALIESDSEIRDGDIRNAIEEIDYIVSRIELL